MKTTLILLLTFMTLNIYHGKCTSYVLRASGTEKITDSISDNKLYEYVDKKAKFPGGMKALYYYISQNIKLPDSIQRELKYKVVLKLVIDRSGDLIETTVLKSGGIDYIDRALVDVIKKAEKWEPDSYDGQAVKSQLVVPITFDYKKGGNKEDQWPYKPTMTSRYSYMDENNRTPLFPGGDAGILAFIYKNLEYPERALRDNITGVATVTFLVDTEGKVCDLKIEKSSGDVTLDHEALRVLKLLPSFVPAVQKGKLVNTKYTMNIKFDYSNPTNRKIY
ncbi:energy transducer TonB [Porphyromonas pogonae]|uniref:energy transducer TonB n=1 Tax=Porphyromonas pogonae TaxID=867595 RepID=UPI002E761189|nr:energy transducer TonB [Porphyromonas pogonae]